MRKVNRFPEFRDADIGVRTDASECIDALHDLSDELLDGLAFCAVVTVILAAKSLGSLQSLRLAVYNLGDVVPDVECTVSLEDMTILVSSHAALQTFMVGDYATSVQRHFGNLSVSY